jgi:hypothetical protein
MLVRRTAIDIFLAVALLSALLYAGTRHQSSPPQCPTNLPLMTSTATPQPTPTPKPTSVITTTQDISNIGYWATNEPKGCRGLVTTNVLVALRHLPRHGWYQTARIYLRELTHACYVRDYDSVHMVGRLLTSWMTS